MKILLFIGLAIGCSALMYLFGFLIFNANFRRAKDLNKIEAKALKQLRKHGCADMADRITEDKQWLKDTSCEEAYIESFDKLKLYGRFYSNPQPCGKTVILLHEYKSSPDFDFVSACKFLFSLGLNILAVDQRAHGKSEGEYISLGVAERFDAIEWAKWVSERCGEDEGVIFYGVSMGATAALLAVSEEELGENVIGVIADSGYIGPWMQVAAVMRRAHIPTNPLINIIEILCMLKGRFSIKDCTTTNSVTEAQAPILFITGDKDDVVSPDDSRINSEQCASRSELLVIPGAGHYKAFLTDEEKCGKAIAAFIESLEGPPSPERALREEENEEDGNDYSDEEYDDIPDEEDGCNDDIGDEPEDTDENTDEAQG